MINWIRRWFNTQSPAPAAAAVPVLPDGPAPVAAVAAAAQADTLSIADLPTLFYRSLAPAQCELAPQSADQRILDALAHLAETPQAGADLVPRVPAVIPQLLKSLRDDDVSGAELSRQLAQDVVLVAEVIREANSAFYRPPSPVRTIEGAVMQLGQNGMRMLLARVAFRPIINMQTGHFASTGAPIVWRQSEGCALAASLLAPGLRANVFEAYLAGLLHHVGLIVALRLMDQMVAGASLPAADDFVHALLPRARQLSASIADLWEFPASVSAAISAAGDAGAASASALARTLAAAERLATLRVLADGGQLDIAAMQALAPAPQEQGVFDQLRMVA